MAESCKNEFHTVCIDNTCENLESEVKIKDISIVKWVLFVFLSMISIGLIVSYPVLGIKFLIDDYDISNNCKSSYLWEYVLVSIIISLLYILFLMLRKVYYENSNQTNSLVFIVPGFIILALVFWGGFELFDSSCNVLLKSNLWKFALVTFAIQIVAVLILLFLPLLIIISIKCYLMPDLKIVSPI